MQAGVPQNNWDFPYKILYGNPREIFILRFTKESSRLMHWGLPICRLTIQSVLQDPVPGTRAVRYLIAYMY
jgi:hypothetical protein